MYSDEDTYSFDEISCGSLTSSSSKSLIDTLTVDSIDLDLFGDMTLHGADNSTTIYEDITFNVDGSKRSISELFNSVDAIQKRLSILSPNPELLEKYELLQSLYEQYRAAEAILCGDDPEE
tara:strand:+ start:1516 stop:1878 length:363 start_codon:yes stop_codon:yes gene_type:complete